MNQRDRRELDCEQALAQVDRRIAEEALDAALLLEWMRSPCLEVRSAAFALLFDPPVEASALPETSVVQAFFLEHLAASISRNRPGRYTPSRYLAGHALRAWFQRLWQQEPRPDAILRQIRDMMAGLVQQGDADVRDAVVISALEHLFADPSVLDFFAVWQEKPVLAAVFDEARQLGGQQED